VLSQRLISAFYPPDFLTPDLISLGEMDAGLDTGHYSFVLDIPPGFQRDVVAGRRPALQLNVDATQMRQSFVGTGYVQSMIQLELQEFVQGERAAAASPVELAVRMRFNPTLNSAWFTGVMEVINMVTMLSIILAGAALIREREHGTLEHLLVMPIRPVEIMLAKVLSMGAVVLLASLLSLRIMVQGVLEMPIGGALALFMLVVALHLFATTSMGIVFGHRGALDAAAGAADHPGAAATADALGRRHAAREHARGGAHLDAAGTDDALRELGSGGALSRGRDVHRVADPAGPNGHRGNIFRRGLDPIPPVAGIVMCGLISVGLGKRAARSSASGALSNLAGRTGSGTARSASMPRALPQTSIRYQHRATEPTVFTRGNFNSLLGPIRARLASQHACQRREVGQFV